MGAVGWQFDSLKGKGGKSVEWSESGMWHMAEAWAWSGLSPTRICFRLIVQHGIYMHMPTCLSWAQGVSPFHLISSHPHILKLLFQMPSIQPQKFHPPATNRRHPSPSTTTTTTHPAAQRHVPREAGRMERSGTARS